MSKFLIYTDLHLTQKRPSHRVDDYRSSILAKLVEVYDIAHDRSVDAVIFLGDFFNNHRVFAYDMINDAMDIVAGSDVETLAIVGQHDIVGYNESSYSTSTLCFFERWCSSFRTMRAPEEFPDTILYPCHAWDDFAISVCDVNVTKRKKSILLAHHLITREKAIYPTYVVDEFLPCSYSAVLFGDYHSGMEQYTDGETLVWSPGAIARMAINESDRVVKVGIVESSLGKPVAVEEIELESAQPGCDVLKASFAEGIREHARMTDPSAFFDKILQMEAESVDVFDLVRRVGDQQGVRKEVMDYILSKRR